jgi:hypothetical protein
MESETFVKSGKYKFRIVDKISKYEDKIIGRNIKIGGNYPDCVNISISYYGDTPVSAYIPILVYDSECSLDIPLDRGKGSITMIKEILKYMKQTIPEITSVNFEDLSQIECATLDEISKYSGMKKKGTQVKPVPLNFFSIMFNGLTWYEKHLNARLKNDKSNNAYRSKVNQLLSMKTPEFTEFLQIAKPPLPILPKLKEYYDNAHTYTEFFSSIPMQDRCIIVRDWITSFMQYYIGDVFSNNNWIIPIQDKLFGGRRKSKRMKTHKLKYSMRRHGVNNDIGVDALHI